ncbi:MAG: phosphotransferase [Oscillospiraceae bacterium]|nr:phosphotransferase [Oscillospiraceae bacterium]
MISVFEEHTALLQAAYGLEVKAITPLPGGWSALAYRVDSVQGAYFLKVYNKRESGTAAQLEKLDLCMAVACWLESYISLHGCISAPLLTKEGNVKAETQGYACLLFPYIDGITPRGVILSTNQQQQLSAIVGELHRHGTDVPFDLSAIQEDYNIPCAHLLNLPHKPGDPFCIYRQRDTILCAINQTHELAQRVKTAGLPFVLCHTDIHGSNLMQSDRLVLIDWESIKFAPPRRISMPFGAIGAGAM